MPVVKIYANLRKLAGMNELLVHGSTLAEVISELIRQAPALEGVILEGGSFRQYVVVTVNGHHMLDLNKEVSEEDVIAIFPPIAGG